MKSSFAKFTSFLLALVMVFCMIPVISAADKDEDGVVYEGTTLVSADKNLEGVYLVKEGTTKIADNAFKDCNKLTAIVLSEELVSLGAYAFDGCESLEYIRTYDNITEIAANPFGTSGDNVCVICRKGTSMQKYAYNNWMNTAHPAYKKQGIEAAFIDGSLTVVGFDGDPRQIVILPGEINGYPVINIFPGAFRGSDKLEYITLGTIQTVGESAFENCEKLNNVDILNEDIIIKENAFKNTPIANDPLNNSEGVLYIDDMAVYADKDIEGTVHILHGTKYITGEVFKNCKKLENVIIPEGFKAIGPAAFANCENLTSVRTPSTFESCCNDAFDGVNENFKLECFDSAIAKAMKIDYIQAKEYELYNEEYDITVYSNDYFDIEIEEVPLSSYEGLDTAFGGTKVKSILRLRYFDPYGKRYADPAQSGLKGVLPTDCDGYFYLTAEENKFFKMEYTLEALYVNECNETYSNVDLDDPKECLIAKVDFEFYSTVDEVTGIEYQLPCGFELGKSSVTYREDRPDEFENYYDLQTSEGQPYVYYVTRESEDDNILKLPTYCKLKIRIPAPEYSALIYSFARTPELIESLRFKGGYLEAEVPFYAAFNHPLVVATTDEPVVEIDPDAGNDKPSTNDQVDPTEPVIPSEPVTTTPTEPSTSDEPVTTDPAENTDPTEDTTSPENTTSPEDETTVPDESDPPTETTTPDEEDLILGDVNRDGKLNIRDATLIQKHLAKLSTLDDEQMIIADITLDKKVNIKDATYIQKKIANLI